MTMSPACDRRPDAVAGAIANTVEVATPPSTRLLGDAVAMVVTRLAMATMGLVDVVMLARHGARDLAAATLVETTLGRGLDVGAAGLGALLPLIAVASPRGAMALGRRASLLGLGWGLGLIVLALALVAIAAAGLLEARGQAFKVTALLLLANLANFALDVLLIPSWGAAGSMVATLTVRAVLMLALLAMAWRLRVPGDESPDMKPARLAHYTVSAMMTAAVMHALGLSLTVFAGRLGTASLAAYAACWSLNLPVMIMASGIGDALAIRVARQHRESASQWGGHIIGLCGGFALAALLLALGAGVLARFISHDPHVALLVAAALPLVALVLWLDAANLLLLGVLRGLGHIARPGMLHIAAMALAVALVAFAARNLQEIVLAIVLASAIRLVAMGGYALLVSQWPLWEKPVL